MRTGTSYSKILSTMTLFMALLLVVFTAGCDRDPGLALTGPDTTGPAVIFTAPANGDASVAVNRIILATFNEAMDPATIISANMMVTGPSGAVSGSVSYAAGSKAAIFTPASNLAFNASYTATVTTGVTDAAGNPMAVNYVWSFTTAAAADTTAPKLNSTNPVDLAVNVPVNKKITATFSEAMDPSTINTTSFVVVNGTTPVAGTVAYDVPNNIATFTPINPLALGTTYTALITTGARDLAGIALVSGVIPNPWTFTTTVIPPAAPTVTSVSPADATTGVAINRKLTATFSEPMSSATITAPGTFTLTRPFGIPVTGTVTFDALSSTATFSPSVDLLNDTIYNATISTGAENPAGTGLASPFEWSFSTAVTPDTTRPLVSFTAPSNGVTGVAVNRMIVATFNEAMDPTTIIGANVLVTGPSGTVGGDVSYAAASFAMTFDPTTNLASSATYTVTITGVTGVKDLAGNFMAANYVWSFTTAAAFDTTAPQVSTTNPVNLATAVPVNQIISATFSEAMDPLTMITGNFTLLDGATPVNGTVAFDVPTNIATFTPQDPLAFGTTYIAAVTSDATDLAGNHLVLGAVPNPWSFTTVTAPGPLIIIDLGLATPFAIASAAGITNTGTTTVNGDVALTPTPNCNAVLWPGCGGTAPIINGTVFVGADPAAIAVRADLTAAYTSIMPANLPGATVLGCGTIGTGGGAGALIGCAGNATLPPGVYISATASSIGVTGDLTLDGQGDANAQFIFQMPSSTLTTAAGAPGVPASRIILINGAKASNVWWQVGSSATIGLYSEFRGNVLADTSITMGTGATSCGRLLAGAVTVSGAFTFDTNVVSVPGNGCPL